MHCSAVASLCRRLFPALRVRVHGLLRSHNYVLLVDVVPVDHFRYRYEYSTWFVAGTDYSPPLSAADARCAGTTTGAWLGAGETASSDVGRHRRTASARCYVHPDSPATGHYWMTQSVVSFYRLKLTNNAHDQHGNVCTVYLFKTVK